uniref:Prohibitin n=1 Tax=Steinernema glaseri TaxID=37863 RepID=A0A1I7Z9C0_9BILA
MVTPRIEQQKKRRSNTNTDSLKSNIPLLPVALSAPFFGALYLVIRATFVVIKEPRKPSRRSLFDGFGTSMRKNEGIDVFPIFLWINRGSWKQVDVPEQVG